MMWFYRHLWLEINVSDYFSFFTHFYVYVLHNLVFGFNAISEFT